MKIVYLIPPSEGKKTSPQPSPLKGEGKATVIPLLGEKE